MKLQKNWIRENRAGSQAKNDDQLTTGEHFAVITLIFFVGLFLVIGVWNAIILANGTVDNGGPLGFVMSYWPIHDATIAVEQSVADVYKNH